MRLFQGIIILLSFIVLAACGGGSSNTSSSSGPTGASGGGGSVNTDTLSLSASSANVTGIQFEALPEPRTIRAAFSGDNTAGVVVGTLPGVDSVPFWLTVDTTQTTENSGDIIISAETTDLPEGLYLFTLRVVTVDANQNVLNQADINVQYDVAAGTALSISPQSINVEMHETSDPITETVSVTAGDYTWSTFGIDANVSVDTGLGSQDVEIEIFPPMPEFLDANGEYTGFVDFVADESSGNHAMYEINFKIFPTLNVFSADYNFDATSGGENTAPKGVNLDGQGLNWQASADQNWVVFSAASGGITTDDALFGNAGDDFTIAVDPTNLSEGVHQAVVTVTAEVGQSIDIPVSVTVGPQVIIASSKAVAFTEVPGISKLEAIIPIMHVSGRSVPWTASTNVSWLSFGASGITGDDIVLIADSSALGNGVHEAIISLSSSDPLVTNTETIAVGLYKSSTAPVTRSVPIGSVNTDAIKLISDPVRPYVYVSKGDEELVGYNMFTGDVVGASINPTTRIKGLTISDDGETLYVSEGGATPSTQEISLSTGTVLQTWPVGSNDIDFVRLKGVPHLGLASGEILNALDGQVVGAFSSPQNEIIDLSKNGQTLCTANRNSGPLTSQCYSLVGFSGYPSGPVTFSQAVQNEFNLLGGFTDNIVVSDDGAAMYLASNNPRFHSLDTTDMTENSNGFAADNFPSSVALGTDGRIYGAYDDFQNNREAVRVYDAEGNTLGTTSFPTEILEGRTLMVSSDSSQLAAISSGFLIGDQDFPEFNLEITPVP